MHIHLQTPLLQNLHTPNKSAMHRGHANHLKCIKIPLSLLWAIYSIPYTAWSDKSVRHHQLQRVNCGCGELLACGYGHKMGKALVVNNCSMTLAWKWCTTTWNEAGVWAVHRTLIRHGSYIWSRTRKCTFIELSRSVQWTSLPRLSSYVLPAWQHEG
jgi:hypothetical protein